jgi:hypothetical protein
MGKVEQGRVIAYDAQTRKVTLIREGPDGTAVLPPVTIDAPTDPDEMGAPPAAGALMRVDSKKRSIVIYDRATQAFRTIQYTPLEDRAMKSITIYGAKHRPVITFAATDELLALPADTWRAGDVVRYYYKEPTQALRLMNVTQTDLSKATG